ncbi:MAG: hypothetical protein ACYCS8_08115 [Acidithiobacillus sp.]
MTDERWNPQTALRRAVPFFQALPHVEQIQLTTCGGESLHIAFDPLTSELVAEDTEGREVGRVPFGVTE